VFTLNILTARRLLTFSALTLSTLSARNSPLMRRRLTLNTLTDFSLLTFSALTLSTSSTALTVSNHMRAAAFLRALSAFMK